jgi:hypothetical protein
VLSGDAGRVVAPWPRRRADAVVHASPGSIASVLVVAFPGGAGTASLVQQARRMASRSPVPISVAEVQQPCASLIP